MEEGKMMMMMKKKEEKRIVVAGDKSEESMYALSWCISNLILSQNTTLFLLYVKPPPPVYSSLDPTGYLFAGDVIASMERYGRDLVNSVMRRAEAVYRDFNYTNRWKKVWNRDAKNVICAAVEKLGADILVMGSHNYGFFKRCSAKSQANCIGER